MQPQILARRFESKGWWDMLRARVCGRARVQRVVGRAHASRGEHLVGEMPPDEKFEHLAQSRCITAALAWRNQNKRGTTR
jgi:hypothetical protein